MLKRWWKGKQADEPGSETGERGAILLRGVAYHLDELAPIERIPALAQDPQLLAAFHEAGHKTYAHSSLTLAEQAICSAVKTLAAAQLAPTDVDAIVVGTSEIREPKRYPEMLSTDLLTALQLSNVPVVGVTLAGCANYSSALRVARNMLIAEGLKNVLVIETNQVRGSMQRQVFDDGMACVIFGDGAASLVVSATAAGGSELELVAMSQTIRPLDWARADINAIAANNFLGFRHVLDDVLKRANATRADIAKVFLSNIALRIVADLAGVLDLDVRSVYTANTSRTAHVWSCDNLINLVDYCAAEPEQVPPGSLFLMVSQAESYFSAIVCRKT